MKTSPRFLSARIAAVALAAATVGLVAGPAMAQTKTLYIGMNGGTMEKTYTEHVFGPFEKANNVKVVVVPLMFLEEVLLGVHIKLFTHMKMQL